MITQFHTKRSKQIPKIRRFVNSTTEQTISLIPPHDSLIIYRINFRLQWDNETIFTSIRRVIEEELKKRYKDVK